MKLIILLVLLCTNVETSRFCQGFEDGYPDGYCYQDPFCIAPVTPVCPIPTVYESYDSYKDGYARGFVRGRKESGR